MLRLSFLALALLTCGCALGVGTATNDADRGMNAAEALEAELAVIPRVCVLLGREPVQATIDRLDSFFSSRAMGTVSTIPPSDQGEIEVCGLAATVEEARNALHELRADLPRRARARLVIPPRTVDRAQ